MAVLRPSLVAWIERPSKMLSLCGLSVDFPELVQQALFEVVEESSQELEEVANRL